MPAFTKEVVGYHTIDGYDIIKVDQVLGTGSFYYCEGCLANTALGNLDANTEIFWNYLIQAQKQALISRKIKQIPTWV